MLYNSAEERKVQEPGDKERIMWRKTLTNSVSHSGPDSPLSHFSNVPGQMSHFQWGLHQCKCSVMFWINPSLHLLLTGFIYHPTRCQETVMWNVWYMHLQHYLQLLAVSHVQLFRIVLVLDHPTVLRRALRLPTHIWVIFTASHTLFILPGIKCRSNVLTGMFISEW